MATNTEGNCDRTTADAVYNSMENEIKMDVNTPSQRALPILLLPVHQVRIVSTKTSWKYKYVPNAPRDGMEYVKDYDSKNIKNSDRWVLDGALLRNLYDRLTALLAKRGRTKRKRAEMTDAIVPVTVNRFVEVDYGGHGRDGRRLFRIDFHDKTYEIHGVGGSPWVYVHADDLTMNDGVPLRVYDGRPLANPGWAKLRRAVCAWAVALAWQRVADLEALTRVEKAMAAASGTEAANTTATAAVEAASNVIAKYADATSVQGKAVLAAAERLAAEAMAPGGAVEAALGEHFSSAATQQVWS
jgi:hypothetical protein